MVVTPSGPSLAWPLFSHNPSLAHDYQANSLSEVRHWPFSSSVWMVGQPEAAGGTASRALALLPDRPLYENDRKLFSQADVHSDLAGLDAPDVNFVLGSSLLTGSSFERRENHGPQVPGPTIGEIRNCLKMRTLCPKPVLHKKAASRQIVFARFA
jgi:hypothetical protein